MTASRLPVLWLLVAISVGLPSCSKGPTDRIVFRDEKGRELTDADLKKVTGNVEWELVGSGNVPANAKQLHEEGRKAGAKGDYENALSLFEKAHEAAPDWPYPVYDAAFTYLLKGDARKAEEYYARVDKMAPGGFFTAKTALDCLRREKAGQIKPGFYKLYVLLEGEPDRAKKKATLQRMVEASPNFPVAWKELALLEDDKSTKLDVIEKALAMNPDAETKGVLLINKALRLNQQGKEEEAKRILGELALDPDSTLGTEHLAKMTLANFFEKK